MSFLGIILQTRIKSQIFKDIFPPLLKLGDLRDELQRQSLFCALSSVLSCIHLIILLRGVCLGCLGDKVKLMHILWDQKSNLVIFSLSYPPIRNPLF